MRGSSGTRNRQVYTPVSAILKFAGIATGVRRLKAPPGIVRWLEPDEAGRLIAACAPHLRPLVKFLLLTGARAGEALWLDWSCVDLTRAHINFPQDEKRPCARRAVASRSCGRAGEPSTRNGAVFRKPNGKPYKPPRGDGDTSAGNKIRMGFRGALRRAGLENFRVHDCRHTWATWHYREHRDLIALQQLGGWRTLSMVTRYAHASSENYRAGLTRFHHLGRFPGSKKRVGLQTNENNRPFGAAVSVRTGADFLNFLLKPCGRR